MACIIQMQRRAIEDLRPKRLTWRRSFFQNSVARHKGFPLHFSTDRGEKLFLYGISEGFGTCSGIHNMNVAVMGTIAPSIKMKPNEYDNLAKSEYFVLLTDETQVHGRNRPSVKRLEVLFPKEMNTKGDVIRVVFKKTGDTTTYVDLI